MEKHIHHFPHLLEQSLHAIMIFLVFFKTRKPKQQEARFLGDNFPYPVTFKEAK